MLECPIVFLNTLSCVLAVEPYKLNFTSNLKWWIGGNEFTSSSIKLFFFVFFFFIVYFSGVYSFFPLLFEWGTQNNVSLNLLLWFMSATSEKYSCFNAYFAVILSWGSYASSLWSKSISSFDPEGRSLSKPIPFLCWKLNSSCPIWLACVLKYSRS